MVFNRFLFILFLTVLLLDGCKNSYKVIETSSKNNTVDFDFSTSDSLYSLVRPFKERLEVSMSEVLNQADVDLEVGVPEGLLNNFVADLSVEMFEQKFSDLRLDICLFNNGGLRTPIVKGNVTRGMLFELMPFENELVLVKLSGAKVTEMIEYIVDRSLKGVVRTGVSVSGVRIEIGNGVATKVLVQEIEFDADQDYYVLTSDYLAGGGDEMNFFLDPLEYHTLGMKLRDVIIDYIVQLKEKGLPIHSELDGRVYMAE